MTTNSLQNESKNKSLQNLDEEIGVRKHSPLVPHAVPPDRGRLGDILVGDRVIRPLQQDVRRDLAANDGDLGRQVNPKHAQHASFASMTKSSTSSSSSLSNPRPRTRDTSMFLFGMGLKRGGSAITRPVNQPGLTNPIETLEHG